MTKTKLWEEVQKLLADNKASAKLTSALQELLSPKTAASQNPPKVDKDGNITHVYCRFHKQYEPVANMVMSGGKSKGYCKASISLWNKMNSNIKKLNAQVTEAIEAGDMDKAQKVTKEAQSLKAKLNDPKTFDYDRDWATFNK